MALHLVNAALQLLHVHCLLSLQAQLQQNQFRLQLHLRMEGWVGWGRRVL